MWNRSKVIALLLFLLNIGTPDSWAVSKGDPGIFLLPDLVEKTSPGVVNISTITVVQQRAMGWDEFLPFFGIPQSRKIPSLGSGFIIDQDGFVLTNNHVVDRASEVMVVLNNQKQFRANLIGRDPKLDVALLQIQKGKEAITFKPCELGDSNAIRIGEPVYAIGNPFGLQHTVTNGIISAAHRTIGVGPFDNFLQTNADINPGNSGGPLFNYEGKVIGINTLIFSRVGQNSGVSFAIPVNEVKKILSDLKRYGRVPRPWLGVLAQKVTPQLQYYYQLPRSSGVLIYNLVQKGPAHRAGIEVGDILVQFAGKEVQEHQEVERLLAEQKPNQTVTLKIQRGKKQINVQVTLQELPKNLEDEDLPQGVI